MLGDSNPASQNREPSRVILPVFPGRHPLQHITVCFNRLDVGAFVHQARQGYYRCHMQRGSNPHPVSPDLCQLSRNRTGLMVEQIGFSPILSALLYGACVCLRHCSIFPVFPGCHQFRSDGSPAVNLQPKPNRSQAFGVSATGKSPPNFVFPNCHTECFLLLTITVIICPLHLSSFGGFVQDFLKPIRHSHFLIVRAGVVSKQLHAD